MVQGEKSSALIASACSARTSDPFARKAGFEAVQRMDKQAASASWAEPKKKEEPAATAPTATYGSWGSLFQNKQNFAAMHWC